MKLIDALKNVIRTEENSYEANIEDFLEHFGFENYGQYSQIFGKHLKGYWLKAHLCTDEIVGWSALYLNDELVASAHQAGRKASYVVYYINDECAQKVKNWVQMCLAADEENHYLTLAESDLNKELTLDLIENSRDFGEQLLNDDYHGTYNGEPVTIKSWKDTRGANFLNNKITVHVNATGKSIEIRTRDYKFPLRVNKDIPNDS